MSLTFHWFLPTYGDSRNLIAGGHGNAMHGDRPATLRYLNQVAAAAEEQSAAANEAQSAIQQQAQSLDQAQVAAQAIAALTEDLRTRQADVSAAEQVGAAAEELSATVQELSSAANQIMAAVEQINRGSQQQASATQQTSAALAQIEPLVGPRTAIVSFQNGVLKDDALRAAYGAERVMGGVGYVATTIEAPGVSSSAA